MLRAARAVLAGVGALALLVNLPAVQASAATCGNGIVEKGEQCDDGNPAPGGCCSPTCTFYSSLVDCGPPAADECQGGACDGAGTCVIPKPAGSLCTSDGLVCTRDVCDGAGACIHPPSPTGSSCEANNDLCSEEECNGAGSCIPKGPLVCNACSTCYSDQGCVGTPRALGSDPGECKGPVAASTLRVIAGSSPTKNRLAAKLVTLAGGLASFGDPTTSTDYQLCVFQTDGSRDLALWAAPAGSGWKPDGAGFSYKFLDPTGLNQLKIKLSPGGNVATLVVKARGAAAGIAYPGFVGVAPFQVELRGSNGECWGASFAAEDSKVDGGKLRARTEP